MGVFLNVQFLVKRLEYDRYFFEKSVHRLLKIQSSHHKRSHLHISIPLLSLIKTKQAAIVVLELESRLGVKIRVRFDEFNLNETSISRKHNMQMRASSADSIGTIFSV